MQRRRLASFVRDTLLEPGTYVTALVVGTFINLFGHALVPWLAGEHDLVGRFVEKWQQSPVLTALSVVVGFAFPLLVGSYASVRTRWRLRHHESRAEFPDNKPDPVFRARPDGSIVEVGASTAALFERYGVQRAQDVLGDAVWSQVVDAVQASTTEETVAPVHFAPAGHWYLVGWAPGSNGTLNVYLTRVSSRAAAGGAA